jgi:V/A-type H+/Na+-transporting ATPase subunit D
MPSLERVPSGRAGRLWLAHRISVAERGADQLERKTQILSIEVARCREVAEQRRSEWTTQSRLAERWMIRASLLGGHDGIRAGWTQPVDVQFGWTSTMGVRHPGSATVAEAAASSPRASTAAVACAHDAYLKALRAALDTAVADAALAALEESLLATRRRARILRRHWVPRLRARLDELELALEQSEHEDQARLRRGGDRS